MRKREKRLLTHARLVEVLDYDPVTGFFTWKHRADALPRWNTRYAGKRAGQLMAKGYRLIAIDRGIPQYAHRLAWFYVHGEWPPSDLDHENRRRDDNWIDNLRPATNSQNGMNKSGVRGVSFYPPTGKWRARISVDKREVYLGYFLTEAEAMAARREAAERLHGEFAGHLR